MLVGERISLKIGRYTKRHENLIRFLYYMQLRQTHCLGLNMKHTNKKYVVRVMFTPTACISVVICALHFADSYKIIRWQPDKPVHIELVFDRLLTVNKPLKSLKVKPIKKQTNTKKKTNI